MKYLTYDHIIMFVNNGIPKYNLMKFEKTITTFNAIICFLVYFHTNGVQV